MTEENPDGSNAPEQEPTDANPDNPSAPAQEQQATTSKPHRSDSFWLALVGIVATAIAAVTGNWFTYQSAGDKIQADAKRATIDQRRPAYANFLDPGRRMGQGTKIDDQIFTVGFGSSPL